MDIIIRPIIELVKSALIGPFFQEVSYMMHFEENLERLEKTRQELNCTKNDIGLKIVRANLDGRRSTNEVSNLIQNIGWRIGELIEIEIEFGDHGRCLQGCLPNYALQRKLGKKSARLIQEMNKLIELGRTFTSGLAPIVVDQPQGRALCLPPPTPLVGKAATETFHHIWEFLMNEEIQIIGVHGMGGVGKTTIVKNIYNRLRDRDAFNKVVMVTISQDFNLLRLQENILNGLGLELPKGENLYKSKLCEATLKMKRVLFILDDLWSPISLEEVGIPTPNAENGCKVVVTSREYRVCQQMETHQDILVKVLCKDDAWTLFKQKVGPSVLENSNLENIARSVARECEGLPLAIIAVGLALRNEKNIGVWRNALNELANSSPNLNGMEQVMAKLKYSYYHLRNDHLRSCFLYCALFLEDHNIALKKMTEYWIWEGLIPERQTEQEGVDQAISILSELKGANMLETDDHDECYRMHDLMRDMAVSITRNDPHFMIKVGNGSMRQTAGSEWSEHVERISLMNGNIKDLSIPHGCPKLQTLLLKNNPLSNISWNFFENMHNLRVLDMSHTNLEALPKSLSELENLHALLLDDCRELKNLLYVDKLKQLRCLRVSWACIEELPDSLFDLMNLREVSLCYCEKIEEVAFLDYQA